MGLAYSLAVVISRALNSALPDIFNTPTTSRIYEDYGNAESSSFPSLRFDKIQRLMQEIHV